MRVGTLIGFSLVCGMVSLPFAASAQTASPSPSTAPNTAAPAPAAPAAPAVAAPSTAATQAPDTATSGSKPRAGEVVANRYFIFFHNKETTPPASANKVVDRAADNAKKIGATRISIVGYSDLPKTDGDPQAVAQARADAVKAELVKQGVPEGQIETEARAKEPPTVRIPGNDAVNHRVRVTLFRSAH